MCDLEKFIPLTNCKALLNALYEEVKVEVLGLEDLLKLPLNSNYKQANDINKYRLQEYGIEMEV